MKTFTTRPASISLASGFAASLYLPSSDAFLTSQALPIFLLHGACPGSNTFSRQAFKNFDDEDTKYISVKRDDEPRLASNSSLREFSGSASIASSDKYDEVDIVGGGTLGDIMSSSKRDEVDGRLGSAYRKYLNGEADDQKNAIVDGLVTREGGELNSRFPGSNFTPLERIAVTANGNLQRIFSSYYDAPVHVHVDSCVRRRAPDVNTEDGNSSFNNTRTQSHSETYAVWDRVVRISVHGTTLCKATSIIHVHSSPCIRLIEEGKVGLGQLFRYLNKLPTFSLIEAGRAEPSKLHNEFEGGIWRTYELQCEEILCIIHEEFRRDAWNISP